MRKFIVRQCDAEGNPIISEGKSSFWGVDEELVPWGYKIETIENSPKLKTIYVVKEEAEEL